MGGREARSTVGSALVGAGANAELWLRVREGVKRTYNFKFCVAPWGDGGDGDGESDGDGDGR